MSHYSIQAPAAGAITSAVHEIRSSTSAKMKLDVAVSTMTSFRVGGDAAVVIGAETEDDLIAIGPILARHGICSLVVGRGSNILVSDLGFHGAVIRLGKKFDRIDGSGASIRCGASTSFPQVANWAARRSLTGLEFAVAIPSSVGGAVRMNAGAHGRSVSDGLASARIVDLDKGAAQDLNNRELGFTYRYSRIGWNQVVVSAEFELALGDRGKITKQMETYRDHRARTQPSDAPNAGSMFKNPDTRSAGSLVERCGLKGYRVGGAEVSTKHANFFLAHPGARAQDVLNLMLKVQTTVLTQLNELLIPEVEIVGEFEGIEGLRWR